MTADPPKGRGAEQDNLRRWLLGASGNSRRLTETWSLVKAWEAGAMPVTQAELLHWALILQRGARRAQRLIDSADALTCILVAKMVESGMSGREVARALALRPTRAHEMKVRGREIIDAGRMDDGQSVDGPVPSGESDEGGPVVSSEPV